MQKKIRIMLIEDDIYFIHAPQHPVPQVLTGTCALASWTYRHPFLLFHDQQSVRNCIVLFL